MSWIKIDDGYMGNRKIIGLKDNEFRLWHAALAECNKQANDGVFPKTMLKIIFGYLERPKTGLACTQALVKAGLWEVDGSNIKIRNYLKYQTSSSERKRLNAAAAKRMQKHRDNHISRLTGEGKEKCYSVTDTVTNGVTNAVTSPVVTPEVRTVFAPPDPTRPDPTTKKEEFTGQVQNAPRSDLPGTDLQQGFALQLVNTPEMKPARSRAAKQARQVTNGARIFQAYLEAFGSVYRNASGEPVAVTRDSRTNTHFARIAVMAIEGRPPDMSEDQAIEEASEVARRYVRHSDAMYVRAQHSPGLLEMHWHKLLTETRTGRQVTARSAREKERIGGNRLLELAARMKEDEDKHKRDAIDVEDK